ncbi:MAG: hypothetical protein GX616_14890 [Planctomycetes bacterium]|nr:hypothetical protein [Planctomycetota bacterium]
MACELKVFNTETKAKQAYLCDEDNAGRMVENDFAAKGTGEYTDTSGKKFVIDWTKHRLVAFKRGD